MAGRKASLDKARQQYAYAPVGHSRFESCPTKSPSFSSLLSFPLLSFLFSSYLTTP